MNFQVSDERLGKMAFIESPKSTMRASLDISGHPDEE
jgi:hypothetical protein